jgi:hypothetical protein
VARFYRRHVTPLEKSTAERASRPTTTPQDGQRHQIRPCRDIGRIWRAPEGLEYCIVGINEGISSTETPRLASRRKAASAQI